MSPRKRGPSLDADEDLLRAAMYAGAGALNTLAETFRWAAARERTDEARLIRQASDAAVYAEILREAADNGHAGRSHDDGAVRRVVERWRPARRE